MESTIYHIYDKIFKKILTLSSAAVVNLINGLFDTNYPTDSTITYNWTEFEKEDLKKILADTILTINGRYSYHIEAQMEKDETIILRVFDYGYAHAQRYICEEDDKYYLKFPEPKIIYLYTTVAVPDEYELYLDFGNQGLFPYRVTVCNFQKISTDELNERKMIILIPFTLLRVRELLKKKRSLENLEMLKTLIQNDIIESINRNLEAGNITAWDARKLKRYTHKLYEQIYSHYEGMEELNEMTDESLMLDVDIMEKKMEELEKKIQDKELEIKDKEQEIQDKEQEIQDKEQEIQDKKQEIKNKEKELKEKQKKQEEVLAQSKKELEAKDKEIERLREILVKNGIQL